VAQAVASPKTFREASGSGPIRVADLARAPPVRGGP
jgi:hypothetical protein